MVVVVDVVVLILEIMVETEIEGIGTEEKEIWDEIETIPTTEIAETEIAETEIEEASEREVTMTEVVGDPVMIVGTVDEVVDEAEVGRGITVAEEVEDVMTA